MVVDASVAVKWLLEEENSDRAARLAHGWSREGVTVVAPYLLPAEVCNALHRRVTARFLSGQQAVLLFETLTSARISLAEPPRLHTRALELADHLRLPAVYDSHYLALAEIIDCEMWTADERFYRAAAARFPRVHWIGES